MKSEWLSNVGDYICEIFKEYKPEIKIAAGTAMIIGGGIHACYQTTKLKAVNDANLQNINDIHAGYNALSEANRMLPDVQKKYRKDVSKARAKQIFDLAKLYAIDLGLVAGGIYSITSGVQDFENTIAEDAIAYSSLLAFMRDYRKRQAEYEGQEVEEKIYHGIKEEEVDDFKVNEKGKIEPCKKTVRNMDDIVESPYARFFAEYTTNSWDPNPEISKNFLLMQQAQANEIFESRFRSTGVGYLYLNEVLDMLGFPMTDEGQDVGWYKDRETGCAGDDVIDFGINRPINARFLASSNAERLENVCALDFNCVGNIRPLMFRKRRGTKYISGR